MRKVISLSATFLLAGLTFFVTACTPENQPDQNAAPIAESVETPVERTVPKPEDMTPDDALEFLLDGNRRFREHHQQHPHESQTRMESLREGQAPVAVILGCSDSRVPPAIIFDEGLGVLFNIRNAGNVVDDIVLGSMEYAVANLNVKLILVLGHEKCGAVQATLEGGHNSDHIHSIIDAIGPAYEEISTQEIPLEEKTDLLVRANVKQVVEQIRASHPILNEKIAEGDLRVVGARYDLDSGEVEVIEE